MSFCFSYAFLLPSDRQVLMTRPFWWEWRDRSVSSKSVCRKSLQNKKKPFCIQAAAKHASCFNKRKRRRNVIHTSASVGTPSFCIYLTKRQELRPKSERQDMQKRKERPVQTVYFRSDDVICFVSTPSHLYARHFCLAMDDQSWREASVSRS